MREKATSVARESHRFTGLFEAELLARLMLWRWGHPLADDESFANDLVEAAAEVLQECCDQAAKRLLEDVEPADMNFVAAAWYVEWDAVTSTPGIDPNGKRQAWLDAVRCALPSCFCNPRDLQ